MKRAGLMRLVQRSLAACLFLSLGQTAQSFAADYYTYCDVDGRLIISNKEPPAGSKILKKQDLPDRATEDGSKTPESAALEIEIGKPSGDGGASRACERRPAKSVGGSYARTSRHVGDLGSGSALGLQSGITPQRPA